MNPCVIGFDTSNYRTSVAAVDMNGKIILNHTELLPVQQGERGLRQSEAVFAHIRRLKNAEDELRSITGGFRVAAVSASARPRDSEDSYMPVFEVGASAAGILAAAIHVPLYLTTHQRGHLEAAKIGNALRDEEPLIGLHLSGGTTDLLLMQNDIPKRIGGALDLHAGQLIDRVGVALDLPFPSGPALEKLAEEGTSRGLLGCSMEQKDLFCHLSGAEAMAFRWIAQKSMAGPDIAREVFDFLSRTVARMLCAGEKQSDAKQAILFGGIASSMLFRKMLEDRISRSKSRLKLFFGSPFLCGDNAVGVACFGLKKYKMEKTLKEV